MHSALLNRPAGLRPFVQQQRSLRVSRAVRQHQSPVCEAGASLQFIRGVNETTVPSVQLTRSRTGVSGTATFLFDSPDVFQASTGVGEITGLYMVDSEGTLTTVQVSAKFVNGKPKAIEARYNMRSTFEWDRFMRFMDRYSKANGLGFSKN